MFLEDEKPETPDASAEQAEEQEQGNPEEESSTPQETQEEDASVEGPSTDEEGSLGEEAEDESDISDDELDKLPKKVRNRILKAERGIEKMQDRIDQLTAQNRGNQEKAEKKQTWNDISIKELKVYRTRARESGNDELADHLNDLIAEKTADEKAGSHNKLAQWNAMRKETWTQAVTEWPDLKDTDSEHYRMTEDLIRKNPQLDQIAEGHYAAAKMVAADLLKRRLDKEAKKSQQANSQLRNSQRREGLEAGGGQRTPAGPSDGGAANLDQLREEAENSGDPMSRQWKLYLKALEDKGRAGRKTTAGVA